MYTLVCGARVSVILMRHPCQSAGRAGNPGVFCDNSFLYRGIFFTIFSAIIDSWNMGKRLLTKEAI